MATGTTVRMGRTAVLDTGKMQIVVSEKRAEPFDLGVFTHCGIDPRRKKYVLIKSRQHFRAGFEPIAKHIVMCDGDGCTGVGPEAVQVHQGQAAALSVRSRHAARPQRSLGVPFMAAYDIVIRNGQVADGTGKKLFAADVALKGDRIAAVEAPGYAHGRQRDRRQGQGRGAGLHRRAHPRRHRPDRQSDHGDEGEPGRDHGGLRQLRRLGLALPALRHRPLPVADREEAGERLPELRGIRRQGRRGQARHQRRLPDRPRDAAHERHGRRHRPHRARRPRSA